MSRIGINVAVRSINSLFRWLCCGSPPVSLKFDSFKLLNCDGTAEKAKHSL